MDTNLLRTLEFDKIRSQLAAFTGSVVGREVAEALEPVTDHTQVVLQLEETQEAVEITTGVTSIPLGGIRDIRSAAKRAQLGACLDIPDFLAIGSTLYAARRVKQFFAEVDRLVPRLTDIVAPIAVLRQLENNIESTVSDQGLVKDSASPELARLRRETKNAQQRIKEKLDSILHSPEYKKYFQDVLVTIRGDRYVIPVKQEYRQNFPGIVHDQSASGATVFIEPLAVVNVNNDLKQLLAAEQNEVERVLQQLSSQVAGHGDELLVSCQALGQLDFVFAKAKLAINQQAFKPRLNEKGQVNLRQARHPLIPQAQVVPIDIHIGDKFQVLVITGPNTGGKTVSLKTLGLFALMVQSGLFIPAAAESEMTVFANIFADIGDEQSIEQSLSTFSAHMTHLVQILDLVGPHDLVLIDEIGAGTDPDEGAALAMSILEFLQAKGCLTVATTHYSELKTFAYSRPRIENACVEFDIHSLKPAYRLLIGLPGSSKAFLISARLGLIQSIIERAQQLVDEDYAEFDRVLTGLEEQKRLYSQKQLEMTKLQQELEQLRQRLTDEQTSLVVKKSEILGKAQEEAAQVLRRTKQEAEGIIGELKHQLANSSVQDKQQVILKTRQRLKDNRAALGVLDEAPDMRGRAARPGEILLGAAVYVPSLGQKGIIHGISGDQAVVQMGIMKMNLELSHCRLLDEGPTVNYVPERVANGFAQSQDISRQVDIRGMTIEEGEQVLDKYLDSAVLAGLGETIIIHGKGTGALKKGIRTYLKSHRSVKSIRIGELNEGGDGVTVATLQ